MFGIKSTTKHLIMNPRIPFIAIKSQITYVNNAIAEKLAKYITNFLKYLNTEVLNSYL